MSDARTSVAQTWRPEEDEALRTLMNEFGNEYCIWKAVSKRFPGRTSSAIRNRVRRLKRREETFGNNAEKDATSPQIVFESARESMSKAKEESELIKGVMEAAKNMNEWTVASGSVIDAIVDDSIEGINVHPDAVDDFEAHIC